MKNSQVLPPLLRPLCEAGWPTESAVRAIAGSLILLSLGLSFVQRNWLVLTAFVGINLFQSGLTGWCLMTNLISRFFKKPQQ